MEELEKNQDYDKTVRLEATHRLIRWAATPAQIEKNYVSWKKNKKHNFEWRDMGRELLAAYYKMGDYKSVLKVGQEFLNHGTLTTDESEQLVISAYQLGRKADAWNLLKHQRTEKSRGLASVEAFSVISRNLEKEFGEK